MNILLTKPKMKTAKIKALSMTKSELVLVTKKNKHLEIPFALVDKVYIKKSKLSVKLQAGIWSLLCILVFNSVLFMPMELVCISSLLYIPVVVYMKNYKLYHLHLLTKSGVFYSQNFNWIHKQEKINLVNDIRKALFDRRFDIPVLMNPAVKSGARITVDKYPEAVLIIA